jgi:hypothetical protein
MNPEIMECKKHVHGQCFINYIEEELNNNRFPIRCPLYTGKERHEINNKNKYLYFMHRRFRRK